MKDAETKSTGALSLSERIIQTIFLVRGHKVILDADLAILYGIETRVLTQAVRRNMDRFPPDFMLQLTKQEFDHLRSQSVISRWGGRRYLPFAFTEQGVAMLSSVLRSNQAVQVNIEIIRSFVQLRKMLAGHAALSRKIARMEKMYDAQFKEVFDAIRELMTPPESKKKSTIGFVHGDLPRK